jgi:hypothetical protein
MTEETVILDRGGRLVGPKRFEESLKGVEEPHFVFILEDLMKIKNRSQFWVVNANVFQNIRRYPTDVISKTERVLTHDDFVKDVHDLLQTKNVAWIDTNAERFDWTDIHSGEIDIVAKLQNSPVSKAYVSIQRADGKNDYLSYTIVD